MEVNRVPRLKFINLVVQYKIAWSLHITTIENVHAYNMNTFMQVVVNIKINTNTSTPFRQVKKTISCTAILSQHGPCGFSTPNLRLQSDKKHGPKSKATCDIMLI